ncbi:hypothetical protein tb265_12180 [Gemmatimonadetes bacterium T265]|nr:hypothetical protein tb265_12180 [Gemmatimonadetes bacterium T265]
MARTHPLRITFAAAAAGAALALTPAPARAWDDVGHMAIAIVAWRHMTPAARARAVALLRAAPPGAGLAQLRPNEGGPEARDLALFARAATWADVVRDRRDSVRYATYHHATWHYLSWYWRPDSAGHPVVVTGLPTDSENVVERIAALRPTLADASRPAESRAVALAWVLHLVGDIHNPVHTASRVTPTYPDGDRGGNAVHLLGDGRSTNLHAVWDDLFDDAPGRRTGGEGRGTPGPSARLAEAERAADAMERSTPAAAVDTQTAELRPDVWAREGQALDETAVYAPDLVDGGPIPDGYVARARAVVLPRGAVAGYRLARVLNQAFGG